MTVATPGAPLASDACEGACEEPADASATLRSPYELYTGGRNVTGGTGEFVASAEESTLSAFVLCSAAYERMERALVVSGPLL